MDAIDLSVLDLPGPRIPDPSIWDANLKSIHHENPTLAQQLADTVLPANYQPVSALDGFPTYLLETREGSPAWLTGTAAPRTRATALLARTTFANKNPALATIAAGAELEHLLTCLARQQAVYVFESDLLLLAAVLRSLDFSPSIAAGRCIMLPPESPQEYLEALLEQHPGLLPPTTIVAMPGVNPARIEQVQRICETLARDTEQNRADQLGRLQVRNVIRNAAEQDTRRLAIVALEHDAEHHHLAAQLVEAAAQLGWQACACMANGPRKVGILPHYEALAELDPDLTICIGRRPNALPLRPDNPCFLWHLHADKVPATAASDDTVHLAASPQVAEALLRSGISGARLADFHWALASEIEGRPSDSERIDQSSQSGIIVLMGDLPDTDTACCGIEQPTHKRLWSQIIQTASKLIGSAEFYQPITLLHRAERTCRVALGERTLSERMVRLIEHILIPEVALRTILERLHHESYEVVTIGRGWERCSTAGLKSLTEITEGVAVLAALFAGRTDPLSPNIFRAIDRGWPLVIHSPGKSPLTQQLGGMIQPGQHYEPFADLKQLSAVLKSIRAEPQSYRRRCSNTRDHVRTHHTYAQRLSKLAQSLGFH